MQFKKRSRDMKTKWERSDAIYVNDTIVSCLRLRILIYI